MIRQIQHSIRSLTDTPLKTILLAGFTAGTLDILAAFINYMVKFGKSPVIVLNFIASGVFGDAAFSGDAMMPVWGLIFHYIIAFIWTIFFYLVYQRVKFLGKNILLSGLLYGIVIWLIMNLILVPFSNTPKLPIRFPQLLLGVLYLMICVGLPVSIITQAYYNRK